MPLPYNARPETIHFPLSIFRFPHPIPFLQRLHHVPVCVIAPLHLAALQRRIARAEPAGADLGIARRSIVAVFHARHDGRCDGIILRNALGAVRPLPQPAVAERAEGRQLRAVVGLALGGARRRRDEAEAELLEPARECVIVARPPQLLRPAPADTLNCLSALYMP